MLNVNFSRQAAKFVKKVPTKHGKQIATKIMELRSDPYPSDSIKLKGYPYHRADIGEYRIVYQVAHYFRPCDWSGEPVLSDLQALPQDGQAVITFPEDNGAHDQVWTDIAQAIGATGKSTAITVYMTIRS